MTAQAPWQPRAEFLIADLQRVFGSRLKAVVVYGGGRDTAGGPLTTLALVGTLTQDDLDACARHAPQWGRRDIGIPLMLPVEEFRRSLDAFPLEYADILGSHVVAFGDDPFVGVTIAALDLRRACETQVKSHLLHLREGYIEAHATPAAVAQLVAASAGPFAALLRHVARLHGVEGETPHATAQAGARAAHLPESVVARVLSFDGGDAAPADGARLFADYLAAVEQLARVVDTWHA